MNIYKDLNRVIEYIEEHLEENIDYEYLSKIIGVNSYTFKRIFSIICDISISEYIRNRRLSNAGQELILDDIKIIDVAIKYQYDSATSFSRAFEKFHGIKPSIVKKGAGKLRIYTKLHFNEENEYNQKLEYKIIENEEKLLYGKCINTNNEDIKFDAPKFYNKVCSKYGMAPYGMIEYEDDERTRVKAYWVLYTKKFEGMLEKKIPKCKWISIKINSQCPDDIQKASKDFYKYFWTSFRYSFSDLPEIEFYHDDIVDFLIPIK